MTKRIDDLMTMVWLIDISKEINKTKEYDALRKAIERALSECKAATLETAALKCDAWVHAHCQATGECSYNDCDMVAVATDLATEIRGMKV